MLNNVFAERDSKLYKTEFTMLDSFINRMLKWKPTLKDIVFESYWLSLLLVAKHESEGDLTWLYQTIDKACGDTNKP